MLGLVEILSTLVSFEKTKTVEEIKPVACVINVVEQKPAYDFDSDDSIYKFVSPFSSLLKEQYVPPELVSLEKIGGGNIVVKNNDGRLRSEASSALADLAVAFREKFSKPLIVISSYRGYAYQKNLLEGYKQKYGAERAAVFSAKPGYSEHQLGLAIDIFNTSTDSGYKDYFSWMRENAYKYGWTQSYQKGPEIDGYIVEPWHWRYVGKELAEYLWVNKMTFSEYVRFWWVWGSVAK